MSRTRIHPRVAVVVAASAATLALWAVGAQAAVQRPPAALATASAAPSSSPGQDGSLQITVSVAPKPTPSSSTDPTGSPTPTASPTSTASPSATTDPTGTPAPPAPSPGGGLPRTGAAIAGLLGVGAALVGGGVALRVLARRRRELASG